MIKILFSKKNKGNITNEIFENISEIFNSNFEIVEEGTID